MKRKYYLVESKADQSPRVLQRQSMTASELDEARKELDLYKLPRHWITPDEFSSLAVRAVAPWSAA